MDIDQRILRLGAAAIACALVLRLLTGTGAEAVTQALQSPRLGQALVFISTGRVVRDIPAAEPEAPTEQLPAPESPQTPVGLPEFTGQDAALVPIKNTAEAEVDLQALLEEPLNWELTGAQPAVLILHTHGSESYENTENYLESSAYRTLDPRYNVVSVGERIGALLEEAGIRVLHDRTLHDDPSYSGSYEQARKSLEAYLRDNPSILLVLDIHRDAAEDASGSQIDYTVATDEGTAAQLMLVVGTDAGGLYHPSWRENLSLAVKLQAQLEKTVPGICRDLCLRTSRFNQDLCPGALLVEVGAAGNTRQEALVAAEYLARAIIDLAHGTQSE